MAKIIRIAHRDEFSAVAEEAHSLGDKSFCSPAAIALLTGESFTKIKEMMEAHGRKHRQGTPKFIADRVLDELGFKRIRVDLAAVIASYPKPHCDVLKNVTTHHARRFPGSFDPAKRYLAHVRGHVAAIINGEVQDWSINNSLRIYKLEEIVRK